MKRYPEYKYSGLNWATEIPIDWNSAKLNLYSELITQGPNPNYQIGKPSDQFKVLKTKDLYDQVVYYQGADSISEETYLNHEKSKLRKGDVLIAIVGKGSIGKTNVFLPPSNDCSYIFSRAIGLMRLVQNRLKSNFLYYFFQSKVGRNLIYFGIDGSTGQEIIKTTYLKNLKITIPPLNDQTKIVFYLNQKTHLIDTLIEKKQKQIGLLQEQRAVIINQAVTKGLNPDVPMKDSGIEWLGSVPEHWQTSRLKYEMSHIVDCLHSTPIYSDNGGYPAIRTADVHPGTLDLTKVRYVNESEYENRISRLKPEKDDILYSREGERFGMAALVPDEIDLCLSQRMMMFRIKECVDPIFLMWQLNANFVYQQAFQDVIGATSPHVNVKTIRNFYLLIPPFEEQKEISSQINKNCEKVDATVKSVAGTIETLTEYRTTLISEVVTGKIDVRDEVIPQ